jgi:hypothetical protein
MRKKGQKQAQRQKAQRERFLTGSHDSKEVKKLKEFNC